MKPAPGFPGAGSRFPLESVPMATTTDVAQRLSQRPRLNWVDSFLFAIKVFSVFVILWGIIGYIVLAADGEPGTLNATQFETLVVNGLSLGAMYGLIALGYSMVYGVLGFINFAHGEVFMTGAIVGYFIANAFAETGTWESNFLVSILVVFVAGVLTSTAVAVVVERVAYRPLRGSPRLIPLITSIGVSFFLQNAVLLVFGSDRKTYSEVPSWLKDKVNLGIVEIEGARLLIIVVALLSVYGLFQFVNRTKTGRAMRAVAEDKEIAALMGIDVDRTIVTTFAVGGAMAGVAAVLWAIAFRTIDHLTGFLPGIKAFTAAVLGGIGNMVGAMVGGVALGLFESLGPQTVLFGVRWEIPAGLGIALLVLGLATLAYGMRTGTQRFRLPAAVAILGGIASFLSWTVRIPGPFQIKDVVAFYALFLVLIFRPAGLFGERLAAEDRA
jgi:branched-chain amino acid transport system permease protein